MAKKPQRTVHGFLIDAQHALRMSQRAFGYALGSSHRTASRWAAHQAHPASFHLHRLAKLLLPVDRDLAEEAAVFGGQTLETLGLVSPPPAAPSPVPSPAPPFSAIPSTNATPADLVDIVVCAAAEATDVSPRTLRPTLLAAFRRARQVGLTVEQVEQGLTPPVKEKVASSVKDKGAK